MKCQVLAVSGRLAADRLAMGDNETMDLALQPQPPLLPEEMDPLEARQLLAEYGQHPLFTLLDVRTPDEHDAVRLADDQLADIYDYSFMSQIEALPRENSYLIYCHTGSRSGLACEMMRRMGFKSACNLSGGIKLWIERGLPVVSGD
jgi:rhodanese-related sulfurtransferase